VARGGIDPKYFDRQMDAIERNWSLIELVFRPRILAGLTVDGRQRQPVDMWREIEARQ
jgi:hypothetical protein